MDTKEFEIGIDFYDIWLNNKHLYSQDVILSLEKSRISLKRKKKLERILNENS